MTSDSTIEALQGELERLFELQELMRLSAEVLDFPDMVAIVRVRIPRATFDILDHTPVDRMILRSGSVTAHAGQMLDELNRTLIGPIVHVF